MLILTETDVEEGAVLTEKLRTLVAAPAVPGRRAARAARSRSRSASPAASGQRCGSTRWSATPTRRCTRRSRSAATRPTSSPSPTTTPGSRAPRSPPPAGRGAVEIGQQRPRGGHGSAHLGASRRSPTTAASRRRSSRRSSSRMARQLDLPEAEIDRIRIAALLHDVGKVAVPEEILEKPAALTSAEWRTVVQHPRIGQVILEQAAALKDAVPIILHHHERYSGHGYPFGLRANDIPLGARIVAIADAYDAMTHDRPYKRGDDARRGDQGAATPRRDAVRPRARRAVLRPVRRRTRPSPTPSVRRDERGDGAADRAAPAGAEASRPRRADRRADGRGAGRMAASFADEPPRPADAPPKRRRRPRTVGDRSPPADRAATPSAGARERAMPRRRPPRALLYSPPSSTPAGDARPGRSAVARAEGASFVP